MENKDIIENNKEQETAENQSKQKPKKEKKLHGRRRLFADYQYREFKNKKGKTVRRKVYTGKHYGYIIPKEYKKNEDAYIRKIKLTHIGFFLILTAVWLIALTAIRSQGLGARVANSEMPGYEPVPISDSAVILSDDVTVQYFYVLMPYIVCALPLMMMFLTLVEFLFTKGNSHEQAFMEALTKNLRGQTITFMVAAGISGIGQIVFIITNYKLILSPYAEVGVLLVMLACIGICLMWLTRQDRFKMEVK